MIKKNNILLLIVLFLFSFSIFKTCDLLAINFSDKSSSSQNDEINEIEKRTDIFESSNVNFFQTEEYGEYLYDGTNIFFNLKEYLVKKNIQTQEEMPILKGMHVKGLCDGKDNVYGVITIANGNDILQDYVIEISKDGEYSNIFYKTESSYITSVCYDGKYLYYTNESHKINKIDTNTKEVSIYKSINNKNDYPTLLGIKEDNLYYIDGSTISCINIKENTKKVISNEGCSIYQKPIIYKDSIYMFGNFNNNSIVKIDLIDGTKTTIVDEQYFKRKTLSSEISNFNVLNDYLFLNIDGTIYYYYLKDTAELTIYKEIETKELAVCYENLFFIKNENVDFVHLTWLLSK